MPDAFQARHRQEWLQDLLHRHRTAAGTAAAVRRRERLVQVEVHHVDAEIARPRDAHQRVHVGAIHVHQRALAMQDLRRLRDILFENAERVRIGHHQAGDIVVDRAFQFRQIDRAARVRADVLHRVAGDGRGGRIGAVRRIGDENLLARIAALFEQRAHQQDAGQLAVRAGRGLQRDRVHAGDLGQDRFQPRHHFHAPCDSASG